jgi:hypothetical protein
MKSNGFSKSFLLGPVVFVLCIAALLLTWCAMEPMALQRAFNERGYSPFELATLPFFAAIIPLVWWKCPFTGSSFRRAVLCSAVSVVVFMAVVKELDLHLAAMHGLFPEIVNADGGVYGLVKPNGAPLTGTPFKMRFITNAGAPLAAKGLVLAYFGSFFGLFAALLAYFAFPLLKGIFALHPVAWTMCCFGSSGVMVQMMDRLPAWYRHAKGLPKEKLTDSVAALCTCLEEGGEMMIAVFALIAIVQAHGLYHVKRVAA